MRIPPIAPVLILAAFGSAILAGQTDGTRPAVLDLIEEPERISTLTISADGALAAAAIIEPGKKPSTTVLLYSTKTDAPRRFELLGVVRDLLYVPEGSSVLGIQYKKAKRRESEAQLLRFDPDQPRPRRLLRLPATSRDLEYWPQRDAILISCMNEVRSLLLPDMRSGPLYRLPGDNLAVASIPGSSLIVVGRSDGLILVDLDDPHGLEEMPVSASVALDHPVITIAASPDGSYVLARLADDSVYEWRIDPLPPRPMPSPPAPPPPLEEPDVTPAVEPAEIIEPEAAEQEQEAAPQLRGSFDGPASGEVVAVVLLGPNNVLHEVERIVPEVDGTWRASGLPPGRYRVQLDGGGDRVLVTDPAFLMVDVGEDFTVDAGVIHVLRAL